MKKFSILCLCFGLLYSCQSMQSAQTGTFQKRIQRVTPTDIKNHARNIIISKYHYQLEESQDSRTSIYWETSWKDVELTEDEIEEGLNDVRVRFTIRSRETRSGPQNRYSVHNLKFNADVESKSEASDSSTWTRSIITPQRKKYIESIYGDYKLELESGAMEFN